MNRRDFLQDTVVYSLVGMSLPLPTFSPNDEKVKVAVIGTGGRGTDLIRRLGTVEIAEIVAVCDNYPPHLKRAQEAAGPDAKPYEDYKKMLAEVKPEAVVIASPLYLHFEMCMEALSVGSAVFCEKTMCYTIDQAEKLAVEVRKRKAVFQVGLQRRANPIYRQAASMIESGMLGQIGAVKCQWHRNNDWRRPVPVEKGHKDWKRLEHHLNWRLYNAYSRGLMTELGSHQLDVVNWLLKTKPRQVVGSGGNDYWLDGREVFDNLFCLYEYEVKNPEGKNHTIRVTYSSIQNNAFEGASELIMGSKGTLLLTSRKGFFYQEKGAAEPWDPKGQAENTAAVITAGRTLKLSNDPWADRGQPYVIETEGNDTRDQLVSFLDCARRKDPQTICDVEEGLLDTITALMGHQAIHEGGIIDFPS